MELVLFALVWVLNFGISVWNAYAVGKVWVDARDVTPMPQPRATEEKTWDEDYLGQLLGDADAASTSGAEGEPRAVRSGESPG